MRHSRFPALAVWSMNHFTPLGPQIINTMV
jgi:hypothetical protein